jgi:dephospho-CoA kinase
MVTVIVVGMPGSGKDTLLRAAKSLGFGHVGMGDVVRRFAAKHGIPSTDEAIGGLANSERQKHGDAIWAERTLEELPPGNAIIDGSRSLHEIECFRKSLGPGLRVIAVKAPRELRFRRLQLRQRSDAPRTLDEFSRREAREAAWGLAAAISSADISLDNEGTQEDFLAECLAALKSLLADLGSLSTS